MALIVVGAPLGDARGQRQERLRAIQRLDLALLVDAQHQGLQRRVQVQPHDVAHLLDEQRIAGELEGLLPVRLQAEGAPDARLRLRQPVSRAIVRVLQCVAPAACSPAS